MPRNGTCTRIVVPFFRLNRRCTASAFGAFRSAARLRRHLLVVKAQTLYLTISTITLSALCQQTALSAYLNGTNLNLRDDGRTRNFEDASKNNRLQRPKAKQRVCTTLYCYTFVYSYECVYDLTP